ncbi:histone-arginine methyltransferase CARM1-like [Micropterus dolomieu]|uniref:histone-arginine methyltransferase CARM1-like n=1 Tax=Micropterus dolomieu TaxID=147949 RepID=UPI001E8E19E0|nr:histone-arginine methyltransferase CARM1-like [Micropterus dolomieu]
MEERSEESLTFSVRVFALQEEVRAEEENMETREEEVQVQEGMNSEQQVSVCRQRAEQELTLLLTTGLETQLLTVQDANRASVFQFTVSKEMDCCQVGQQSFLVSFGKLSFLLQFRTPADLKNFQQLLKRGDDEETKKGCTERDEKENRDSERGKTPSRRHPTMFESRTENAPTLGTYQFHSCLSQQQSLLQDYLRITTYQRAILNNETDFRDKVVLDICCGSGILSFFAVQAGATRVYAVEASPMAKFTQILVQCNCLSEQIRVLEGEVEEVSCPDMVDVIVSEPMGYMLLSDGLMERFLHARKWLKPNGLMFPSYGDIHLAPFSDEQLYFEHYARANTCSQCSTSDLQGGMAEDTQIQMSTVWLSTAPTEPLTRWYQVRCLLQTPLFAKLGQTLSGTVLLIANSRQSYDIHITATVDQSGFRSGNILDLKNPFFRLLLFFFALIHLTLKVFFFFYI